MRFLRMLIGRFLKTRTKLSRRRKRSLVLVAIGVLSTCLLLSSQLAEKLLIPAFDASNWIDPEIQRITEFIGTTKSNYDRDKSRLDWAASLTFAALLSESEKLQEVSTTKVVDLLEAVARENEHCEDIASVSAANNARSTDSILLETEQLDYSLLILINDLQQCVFDWKESTVHENNKAIGRLRAKRFKLDSRLAFGANIALVLLVCSAWIVCIRDIFLLENDSK